MSFNSLAKGSAQIRQKDSGAGRFCDNVVIVMCDLTLSVFCQKPNKKTPTECCEV